MAQDDDEEIYQGASQTWGVDPDLLHSLTHVESGDSDRAVSPAGAMGRAQFLASTAREMGVRDPFDRRQAVYGAARYLRENFEKFNGRPDLAIAAYHGGPDPDEWGEKTRDYVDKISNEYAARKQRAALYAGADEGVVDTGRFDVPEQKPGPLSLEQFRKRYQQYNDLSDKDLITRLHDRYYRDIPLDQFSAKMGYRPQQQAAPAPAPSWGGGVNLGWGPSRTGLPVALADEGNYVPSQGVAVPPPNVPAAVDDYGRPIAGVPLPVAKSARSPENRASAIQELTGVNMKGTPPQEPEAIQAPTPEMEKALQEWEGRGGWHAVVARAARYGAITLQVAAAAINLPAEVINSGLEGITWAGAKIGVPGLGPAIGAFMEAFPQESMGMRGVLNRPPKSTLLPSEENAIAEGIAIAKGRPPLRSGEMSPAAEAASVPQPPPQPRPAGMPGETVMSDLERKHAGTLEGLQPEERTKAEAAHVQLSEIAQAEVAPGPAAAGAEPKGVQGVQPTVAPTLSPESAAELWETEGLAGVQRHAAMRGIVANAARDNVAGPEPAPQPTEPPADRAPSVAPPAPTPIRTVQQIMDQDKVGPKAAQRIQDAEILLNSRPITEAERQARAAGVKAEPPPPPAGAEVKPAPAKPAEAPLYDRVPPEPRRLINFLRAPWVDENGTARAGGLIDYGGDIKNSTGGAKGRPGLINSRGDNLDNATRRAWDAGYLPEFHDRPMINDLLEKISDDHNLNPVYSAFDEDARQAYEGATSRNSEIDRLAATHGIETAGKSRDQFFDEVTDKLSLDESAHEMASHDDAAMEAYREAESTAKAEMERRGGRPISPKDIYQQGQARTLRDLEDEHQQIIQASENREQLPAGGIEPGPIGRSEGTVPEGAPPRGGGAGDRLGAQAPAGPADADIFGNALESGKPRAAEPTVRNDPNQAVMPGMEPSARQAQAARDQAGRGILTSELPQKPADEGLFKRQEPEQSDFGDTFYSFPGALFDPAAWKRAFGWVTSLRPPPGPYNFTAARQSLSAMGNVLIAGARTMTDLGRNIRMMIAPMTDPLATIESRAMAKDWADLDRLHSHEGGKMINWGRETFTMDQRKRMWDAADADSVAIQTTGAPHPTDGVASLSQFERDTVQAWQADSTRALALARAVGITESTGLPSYVPRMVVDMVNGIREKFGEGGPGAHAEVSRDILNLPLATMQLRRAIAGRIMINQLKTIGQRTGQTLVFEGGIPQLGTNFRTTTPQMKHRKNMTRQETETAAEFLRQARLGQVPPFTIPGNPAFWTWGPRFIDDGKGGITAMKDSNGAVVMDRKPIYVRADFEGPLRAILHSNAGGRMGKSVEAVYGGLQDLKGRMMQSIMYGVSHLGVVAGRAEGAAPNLARVWHMGAVAKDDPATMRELILAGMAPVERNMGFRDMSGLVSDPQMEAGRSWTSKALAAIPGLFDPKAAQAVKVGVDRLGDFMHNKLLWDQVASIQVGLAVDFRDTLMAKGLDRQTATRVGAYYANTYAGSLPREAMSQIAARIANLLLFSRTYRLGNLAALKGTVVGLPMDIRAQIARDAPGMLDKAVSLGRRKAQSALLIDAGLYYAGNSLLQNGVNVMMGLGPDQDKLPEDASFGDRMMAEFKGYGRRLMQEAAKLQAHPSDAINIFDDLSSLTPLYDHEPGKRTRILVSQDRDGTNTYIRNPTGKATEDVFDYFTQFWTTMKSMLSPFAKPLNAVWTNDMGNGQHMYDPMATAPREAWQGTVNFAKMVMMEPFPWAERLFRAQQRQQGWGWTAAELGAGAFGVTTSHGFPGGDVAGEMANEKEHQTFREQQAMPGIRAMIRAGNLDDAQQAMQDLNMDPRMISTILRRTQNPGPSGSQIRAFNRTAEPYLKERVLGDAMQ